jgi:tagatose-6-phosphate ketose/aldose isomerase
MKTMNAFARLISDGAFQTVQEIAQQPKAWRRTLEAVHRMSGTIAPVLDSPGRPGGEPPTVLLTGAGSSEYVGRSVEATLRVKLAREVGTIPTTHFVTHPGRVFVPGKDYVLVSIARSGNSPESLATFRGVASRFPRVSQIVITCNREGELARLAARNGVACLLLPEETNDKSLAMTSSFSSLVLATVALGDVGSTGTLTATVEKAARGAERIMGEYGDLLSDFSKRPFSRSCYLGSGALYGCMQEGRLKMQEMTAGRVASSFDSFLGLRHGPQVFVNAECVVVAGLSTDPGVRVYELDMLRELKQKKQGCGILVICAKTDSEVKGVADAVIELYPSEDSLEDDYRVLTDVVACQILATFKSISLGLSPDNPSPDGIINRVVEGIVIHS